MPLNDPDLRQLRRALDLAHEAIGRSDPNPRVGCVLADAHGRVIGEGATQRTGEAHAEVMALQAAQGAGASLDGGTAWVTLEPCSHHGRTPPCVDAMVAARLRRVVVGGIDPNPLVAGTGVQRLRDAGVMVDLADGELACQARELNIGFFSRMRRGVPWVRCKIAASLDGRTALDDGRSSWITGAEARRDGHAWRRRAGAVLTGSGTVLADDPRLDVRDVPTEVQPLRVVLDSHLRVSPRARVFDAPGTALVYCTQPSDGAAAVALRARGVDVVQVTGSDDRVELGAVLRDLAGRGINELHVEAGPTLNGALLQRDLVDEYLVYIAPKLIGDGKGMVEFPPLNDLAQAHALRFESLQSFGDDLRIVARRPGRADWLGS
jgi:diaminohydroxyphosphoribosylaminopyrimidine deaminase / 5-amino-6-(5-phosphoribosylamino)uracil reductase